MKKILFVFCVMIFAGCTPIPKQTSDTTQSETEQLDSVAETKDQKVNQATTSPVATDQKESDTADLFGSETAIDAGL